MADKAAKLIKCKTEVLKAVITKYRRVGEISLTLG
jgi:hypothetical protein